MEFSPRFGYDAMSVFSHTESTNDGENMLIGELSLDSNNVFGRSLVVDIEGDEVEVPVIARMHFEHLISDRVLYPAVTRTKKIILPLYDNTLGQERRTFNSILRQFFVRVGYSKRLQKITTNKGEVYYGGKGIIFDGNYTPLLLCTLTAKRVHTDEGNLMVYYRPVCHVSPRVFIESDKLINRGIIKKLIPFYANRDMSFPTNFNGRFISDSRDKKVRVVVDNFDNFFAKPIKPTPSACSNDALNECLIDNIDDILMLI